MKRSLLGDLARYVPGLAVPIAMGTVSTAVFSRIASPSELGSFLLISALVTSVGVPCGEWLRQATLRFYPAYAQDARLDTFLRTLSFLSFVAGFLASIAVAALLWSGAGGPDMQASFLLPAAALAFFAVASGSRGALMQASFALGRFSLINSVLACAKLFLPLILFPILGPIHALLWGSATVAFLGWVVLSVQRIGGQSLAPAPRPTGMRQISTEAIRFGVPLSVSEIGVQVLTYSDRYVIGALLGSAAVGLYSTNYSIAEKLLIMVQAPLIQAAHSQIVSAWEHEDYAHVEGLVRTATRWILLLGTPVVAFTTVRSEMVSSFLLGEEFVAGHPVIPITAASLLLWAITQYGHTSFQLGKQTWIITCALLASAAVNLVSVIGLTASVGYLGGALATAIGYATYAVLIFFLTRWRGPMRWEIPWRTVVHATIAALAAVFVWGVLVPRRIDDLADAAVVAATGMLGLLVYVAILMARDEIPLRSITSAMQARRSSRRMEEATPARA